MITNHGTVPLIYDGLIAKIIVWDHNREVAVKRLADTLFKLIIIGPKTNLELLKTIVAHPDFLNGDYSTQSVQSMTVSKTILKIKDDFYCEQCHQTTTYQNFENYSYVCHYCGYHPRISAKAYLNLLLSKDNLIEVDTHLKTHHHHNDFQYKQKLQATKAASQSEEALACAIGYLGPHQVCLAIFEPFFMMGSLGSVAGEKITRLSEYAQAQKLPLIIISASGGARMQEGVEALMQMAKTTLAIQRFLKNGLFISVCANPTMGGTTASFMMQGDVIVAHPQAHIGFSGKRVVKQTLGQPFDTNVQKSETLHSQGWLDLLVSRKDLKTQLIDLLNLHVKNEVTLKPIVLASNQLPLDASPWKSVQKARDSRRFKASDILAACFENLISFSANNRCLPSSLISCIGLFNDLPVTILAHQKDILNGQSGMLLPSDYRRVVRAIKQAEKFKRPIITLIDTPGADPSMASELKGQASAISESLAAFANAKVCVITIILSEGGSGGALAMGIGDALLMLEHAYYSIISPEGYASILLRDASKAKQVAQSMKITAKELKTMQIVDAIILEQSYEDIIRQIKSYLNHYLSTLMAYDSQTLAKKRYEKYRNIARSDAKHLIDQGGLDLVA